MIQESQLWIAVLAMAMGGFITYLEARRKSLRFAVIRLFFILTMVVSGIVFVFYLSGWSLVLGGFFIMWLISQGTDQKVQKIERKLGH